MEWKSRALESLELTLSTNSENGFWLDRPTLVTGATGLVGGWQVRRLLEQGADVICLVRDWVPQSELARSGLLERVKVVRGDVRDQSLLERILGEYEIDTVLHLAAQTIVGIANRNPVSNSRNQYRRHVVAARSLPEVAAVNRLWLRRRQAYGAHEELPYSEASALQGRHP